jgi:hypothetical protein
VTSAKPIATVRDLISRLADFDADAPIRAQHALAGTADFVMGVGEIPDQPGTIAVIYLPPAEV